MVTIDIHTHIFTKDYIPEDFYTNKILNFFIKNNLINFICKIYFILIKLKMFKFLNKYYNLIKFLSLKTQEDVYLFIKEHYSKDTYFGILSMDFDYLYNGKTKKKYLEQLDELVELKLKYKEVEIFICVDPRRENYLELVKKYINEHNFTGIKLYPPFGFYPFDERLNSLYEWCEINNIPIIAHCGKSFIYYNGEIKEEWKKHPITNIKNKYKNQRECLGNLANAENFKYVLEKYPKLKINLSHLFKLNLKNSKNILELLEKYDNVYTDISYSLTDVKFLDELKKLINNNDLISKKILYGSDLFLIKTTQRFDFDSNFLEKVIKIIGEKNYMKISYFNNTRFLYQKKLKN